MTIEAVAERINALELQMAKLTGQQSDAKPVKKTKKKTTKKDDSDDDTPKKKRTSGYIIFSNATRDDVKYWLAEHAVGDDKPKNTDVMKELARQWKALSDEERGQWNEKAVEIRNA